jgi:hypothetical protein
LGSKEGVWRKGGRRKQPSFGEQGGSVDEGREGGNEGGKKGEA